MIKYLIPLLFIGACKTNSQYIQDDLINQYFSKNEVKQLGEVLKFYDEHVMASCNQNPKTLANCYTEFGEELLAKLDETGIVYYPIEFNQPDTTSIKSAIENVTVFNEIWDTTTWYIRDTFPHDELTYKRDGKYIKFIKAVSEKDSLINHLFSPYDYSGGSITPAMIGEFLYLNKFEPFTDKQRLIIAIHYLTVTYPLKTQRKEEYDR